MSFNIFSKCKLILRIFNARQDNVLKLRHAYFSINNNGNNLHNTEDNSDEETKEYEQLANKCFDYKEHTCLIIHPYVKWGPKLVKDTSPENQISEAVALVNTLTYWKVHDTMRVPLENLEKKTMFGSGTLEKLKHRIRSDKKITAVFINVSVLKTIQIAELERVFGVTVFDRYKIVVQILRLHATSKHAKLQVALAEIPYLRSRLKHIVSGGINAVEIQRKLLNDREHKLQQSIQKLRTERELLRNKRRQMDFPVVAVIGYTNSGKTTLIKTLTGEQKLEPRNQLFATLDVTMHIGALPSKMEVLYVDTVGFISNVPTNLIECFTATLEDAMLADVIVHVQDASNEDMDYQSKHVITTLEKLALKTQTKPQKIITVYNKIDKVHTLPDRKDEDAVYISATNETGIDVLRQKVEEAILKATNRSIVTLSVPTGGNEYRWQYKNATILEQTTSEDGQSQIMKVIITQAKLNQFNHYFVKTKG